jgi:pyruvate/2-oxoglutarate dehydrogenase complex dihydrolipoamide acyltransferase (E2) component
MAKTKSGKRATVGGGELVNVNAPMDGEGVYIVFDKKVGEYVTADEVIGEIESDKASIEIVAPRNGLLNEICVAQQEELDVTDETRLCIIETNAKELDVAAPQVVLSSLVRHATVTSESNSTKLRFHCVKCLRQ